MRSIWIFLKKGRRWKPSVRSPTSTIESGRRLWLDPSGRPSSGDSIGTEAVISKTISIIQKSPNFISITQNFLSFSHFPNNKFQISRTISIIQKPPQHSLSLSPRIVHQRNTAVARSAPARIMSSVDDMILAGADRAMAVFLWWTTCGDSERVCRLCCGGFWMMDMVFEI
ncbi:hypothetical protein LWI29_020233 [Acer saccharum]|uniref:Uncharacterized protein n=1 Tax=Acer saccharum TaxID=4024 RepID=A0AA39SJG4_ACESA|nr:hypothetical protein LWI29_020233 [Acer saccharum]